MRPSWRRPVGGFSKLGARKYCFTVAAIDIDLPRCIHSCVTDSLEFATGCAFAGFLGLYCDNFRGFGAQGQG